MRRGVVNESHPAAALASRLVTCLLGVALVLTITAAEATLDHGKGATLEAFLG